MTSARRAYSYGTGLANRQTSMAAPSRATFSGASRSRRYAAAISRRGSMPPASPRASSGAQAGAPRGAVAPADCSAASARKPASGRNKPAGPGGAAGEPTGPGMVPGGAEPSVSSRAAAPDSMMRSTRS
jgi:hypothetical protein